MSNERITEGIVRDHFKADPHYQSIKWDEQKTANKRISNLLKGQSKGGGKGDGRPEFIISFPMNGNYLIVVECKGETSKHRSASGDNAKDFAVDGVLHYAKALSKEFSVIAIAVSGERESELLVSHFYWKKGAKKPNDLPDEKLLAIGSYLQVFDDQFFMSDFYFRDIAAKARELNETLYQYSIKELSRCTLVSAVLLALKDKTFVDSYADKETIQELGEAIIAAIDATFKAENDIVRNAAPTHREGRGNDMQMECLRVANATFRQVRRRGIPAAKQLGGQRALVCRGEAAGRSPSPTLRQYQVIPSHHDSFCSSCSRLFVLFAVLPIRLYDPLISW